MRSQLCRLAEVAEHPKTTIQVIRSGGAHTGLLAHFVIADLDGKPPSDAVRIYDRRMAFWDAVQPDHVRQAAAEYDELGQDEGSWRVTASGGPCVPADYRRQGI